MWQLSGTLALLSKPSLEARLDLARPDLGLHSLRVGEANLTPARVLCLQADFSPDGESNLVEAYLRGTDLVTVYAPSAERRLRPQLYFRELTAGVELIVSAQTDLLGVDSSLSISSELPAEEVWQLLGDRFERVDQSSAAPLDKAAGVFLFRVPGSVWSYVEMVFPTDFANASLTRVTEAPSLVRLVNTLFPEQLEKGVIRRGRLRGCFVPRESDEDSALAAYREFVASPVPLTT